MKYHSKLIDQQHQFLAFNKQGESQMVKDTKKYSIEHTQIIKILHKEQESEQNGKKMFVDEQYNIKNEVIVLDKDRRIIFKRLAHLYPRNFRPPFFPKEIKQKLKVQTEKKELPHFLYEVQLFDIFHFYQLFDSKEFSDNGKYRILLNIDGKYQLFVVDDYIAIYEDTEESIWDIDLEMPWLLIIAKAWSKVVGGYGEILESRPFQFVEYFSWDVWKYFNMGTDYKNFIKNNKSKINEGKFLLKTKNSEKLYQFGLIPGIYGYELLDIEEETVEDKKQYLFEIRSVMKHRWVGKFNFAEKQIRKKIKNFKHEFQLERTFIVNDKDFLNLFSSVYTSPERKDYSKQFYNYYSFHVPSYNKNAIYFQFEVKTEGFLDFCVKQPEENKMQIYSNKSKILFKNFQKEENDKKMERFLKYHFMLIRQNTTRKNSANKNLSESRVIKMIEESTEKFEQLYEPFLYESYCIDYKNGYQKSDGQFLNIVPGKYILRVKTEDTNLQSDFSINLTCHQHLAVDQKILEKESIRKMLSDSMISLTDQFSMKSLSKDKSQIINFADTFDNFGYGFVAIKVKKKSKRRVILEIDPKQLEKDGYKLKNKYKYNKKTFSIQYRPGEHEAILLKKIADLREQDAYKWPPEGIYIKHK